MGSSRSARSCRSPPRPTMPMSQAARSGQVVGARQAGCQTEDRDPARLRRELLCLCVRKVWRQLKREGFDVAHCTVSRLMRDMGLQGIIRGKPIKTTISDKAAPCPLVHVNRQFKAPRPNVLRLSDFTYVATWTGFVYVAFVINAYAAGSWAGEPHARRMRASCSTRWSRHCMIDGRSSWRARALQRQRQPIRFH